MSGKNYNRKGGENIDRNQQFSPIRNSRFASEAFPELDQTNSRIKRAKLHHDPMNLPQSRILKSNSPINITNNINNYNYNDTASELSDTSISTSGVSSLHPRSFKRFNLGVSNVRDVTIKTNIQNLNKSINIDSIIRKDNSINSSTSNNNNNCINKTFMSSSSRKILEHLDRLTTPVTANEKLTASLLKYSQNYKIVANNNPYCRNAPSRNMRPLPPMKAVTISVNKRPCGPIRRKDTLKSPNEILINDDRNIDLDLENTIPSLKQSANLNFTHVPLLTVSKSTNTDGEDAPLKSGQSSPILHFQFSNPLKIDDFDYLRKNEVKSESILFLGEKKVDFIKNAAEIDSLNAPSPLSMDKSVPNVLFGDKRSVSNETGFSFTGGKNTAKTIEESSKSVFLSSNSSFGAPKNTQSISTSGTMAFGAPSSVEPFGTGKTTKQIEFEAFSPESQPKVVEKHLETQQMAFGGLLSSYGTPKTSQSALFGISLSTSESKANETALTTAQVGFGAFSSPISSFGASKISQSTAIETPTQNPSFSSFVTPSTQTMAFRALSSLGTPNTSSSMAFGAVSSAILPKSIETPLTTPPMVFGVSTPSNTSISSLGTSKTTPPMVFGVIPSTNSSLGTLSMTFGAPSTQSIPSLGAPKTTTSNSSFGAPSMTFGAPSSQPMGFGVIPPINSSFGAPSLSTPSILPFGTPSTQPMASGVITPTISPFGTSSATHSMPFGAPSLSTPSISPFGTSSNPSMALGVTLPTNLSFGAPSNSLFGTSSNNTPFQFSNSQLSSTFKFGQTPVAGNTASGLATGAFGTSGTNITNNFQPLLPSNKNFAFDSSLPPPSSQNIGGTFQFGASGSSQQFGSGSGSGNMFSGSNSVPSSMDKMGANSRRFAKSRRKK